MAPQIIPQQDRLPPSMLSHAHGMSACLLLVGEGKVHFYKEVSFKPQLSCGVQLPFVAFRHSRWESGPSGLAV